jgi:hypothetical protein
MKERFRRILYETEGAICVVSEHVKIGPVPSKEDE